MTRLEENRFRSLPGRLSTNYPHYIVGGNKLCKAVDTYLQNDITGSQLNLLLVGLETARAVDRGEDPVTDLVVKKYRWRQELELQLSYLRGRNRYDAAETLHTYNKFLIHGKSGAIMAERKVEFIKHVGKDPDCNFDGCCNWFYYGGQLDHFEINGQVILTSVQGMNSDTIYFIPLSKKSRWLTNLEAAAFVSPVPGDTVFQVVSSDQGFTVARCRNHINLYKVKIEQDEIVGCKCFSATSKEPFVSVDLCNMYPEQICSVHMDHNLCIWDMNTQKKLSEHVSFHCSPTTREKWATGVFGRSPHTILYSDRSCVRHFDIREGLRKHVGCWCIRNCKQVEKCECIFSVVTSGQHADSVYVGTSHHMLAIDARKNSDASTECWTHMLQTPPLYGCCSADEKELLVMASQESSEVEIFSDGSLLPVMLQSFTDCLRRSNSCGYNLELRAQPRFKMSVSGLTCIKLDGSKIPSIFVQTSAGDIFIHELCRRSDVFLPESCDLGKHLPTRYNKRLKVTNVLEMNHLLVALRNGCDNVKRKSRKKSSRLLDNKLTWMKSKEELLLYKDLLASSILDAWDVDAMEEWKKKKRHTLDIVDIPPELFKRAKQLLED